MSSHILEIPRTVRKLALPLYRKVTEHVRLSFWIDTQVWALTVDLGFSPAYRAVWLNLRVGPADLAVQVLW